MNSDRVRTLLTTVIDDIHVQIAARDLFALGCYFHAKGQAEIGLKNIATALLVVKAGDENARAICMSLPGSESEYFHAAMPHAELKQLMPEKVRVG